MRFVVWMIKGAASLLALALSAAVIYGGLELLSPLLTRLAPPSSWSGLALLMIAGLGLQRGLSFGLGRFWACLRSRLLPRTEGLRRVAAPPLERAAIAAPRGALRGYQVLGLWERCPARLSFLVRPPRSLRAYLLRCVPVERRDDTAARALIEREAAVLRSLEDVSGAPALREARPLKDGRPMLVVEAPRGEALSELAGFLSLERSLLIAARVAGFLLKAHRRGWALRVLPPEGIRLGEDGGLVFQALAFAGRIGEPGPELPPRLRPWGSELGALRVTAVEDDGAALAKLLCALITGLDDPSILRGSEHRGLIARSLEECGAGAELRDRATALIVSALEGKGPDIKGWLRELADLLDRVEHP